MTTGLPATQFACRQLSMPCADGSLAIQLAKELTDHGVVVAGVHDHVVALPWSGDPMFAFMVAELVVRERYGYDDEVTTATIAALRGVGVIS